VPEGGIAWKIKLELKASGRVLRVVQRNVDFKFRLSF